MKDDVVSIVVAAIIMGLALIFGTTIAFWLAYFGGWLLSCFAGDVVAKGLNMVFGNITQYNFTPEDIPLFSGIMASVGAFFKTSISSKKD